MEKENQTKKYLLKRLITGKIGGQTDEISTTWITSKGGKLFSDT